MRRQGWLAAACLFVLFLPTLLSAAPGSFRGVIVRSADDNPGWIWVKSANGVLRKVGVEGAMIVYGDAVSRQARERNPELSMKSGAEVRITGRQDEDGEWRASKVEILRLKAPDPIIEPSRRKPEYVRVT